MNITLSIKQIMVLAEFSGLAIDEEKSVHYNEPEALETELTIGRDGKVKMEDGSIYTGHTVHFTEYPEEGSLTLDEITSSNTKRPEETEKRVATSETART